MPFFNRDSILALASETNAKSTTLSPETIALVLSASGILEDRSFWDEMTDSEWDEIEAIVANLIYEASWPINAGKH